MSGTETKTQIQVVNNPIPLQGVYMESVKDVMYLDPGQEITTRVAFSPANTTARRNYELSISNESVFSALDFGNDITIRAEQPGSTTFYVLLGGYMGGFRLIVRGYTASMAQKEQTLHEGSSAKLSFTVSPDDGQTKAVWSSNDPQIVSVAQDGIITALREGSTIINASLTFPDGRTGLASCAVTVTPHTGDVLSEQAPTASRDGWQQINCTVCGHEATHILSRRFLDLDGTQWYADGVDDIVDRGLMNGTGPVTFEPDSTMTRAMLVTVLWRSAGSPNEGTNGFTDVPADQWYTQAVAWAAQNGIVNGVGNNKFDPGRQDHPRAAGRRPVPLCREGRYGRHRARRSQALPGCRQRQRLCHGRPELVRSQRHRQRHAGARHGLSGPAGLRHARSGRHAHVPLSQAHGSITEKSRRPSNRAASCFFCCNALY